MFQSHSDSSDNEDESEHHQSRRQKRRFRWEMGGCQVEIQANINEDIVEERTSDVMDDQVNGEKPSETDESAVLPDDHVINQLEDNGILLEDEEQPLNSVQNPSPLPCAEKEEGHISLTPAQADSSMHWSTLYSSQFGS
ncbi:hypothetical protein FGB62_97g01 [Gracilaria domingensis]|nr:hypothetical protein FGB62_97g01 [Gracilaria domingensis]